MASNVHKVPKRQWAKWNKIEQGAFNRMWSRVVPEVLPTGVELSRAEFSVLRFNVCWLVADMMKDWRGSAQ